MHFFNNQEEIYSIWELAALRPRLRMVGMYPSPIGLARWGLYTGEVNRPAVVRCCIWAVCALKKTGPWPVGKAPRPVWVLHRCFVACILVPVWTGLRKGNVYIWALVVLRTTFSTSSTTLLLPHHFLPYLLILTTLLLNFVDTHSTHSTHTDANTHNAAVPDTNKLCGQSDFKCCSTGGQLCVWFDYTIYIYSTVIYLSASWRWHMSISKWVRQIVFEKMKIYIKFGLFQIFDF